MEFDYPELRSYLAAQEGFEYNMRKSAWTCTIKDNEALTALQVLEWNSRIWPSSIVVVMPDGSYKEFWADVMENEQNIPYNERLATYSQYYLIY